jgi:hypothetical protein
MVNKSHDLSMKLLYSENLIANIYLSVLLLSPSCIAILRRILAQFHGTVFGFFSALLQFSHFFGVGFPTFSARVPLKRLSSRNAHLVYQNWYRISFTLF